MFDQILKEMGFVKIAIYSVSYMFLFWVAYESKWIKRQNKLIRYFIVGFTTIYGLPIIILGITVMAKLMVGIPLGIVLNILYTIKAIFGLVYSLIEYLIDIIEYLLNLIVN